MRKTRIDKNRLARRLALAALAAFAVCTTIAIKIGMPPKVGLMIGICAGLAALLSTYMCWQRLVKRGETRLGGLQYGALAGLMTAALTGLFLGLASGIMMLATGQMSPENFMNWLLMTVLFKPLYGAILGGIIAVPLGGIAGYALSKDPPHGSLASAI